MSSKKLLFVIILFILIVIVVLGILMMVIFNNPTTTPVTPTPVPSMTSPPTPSITVTPTFSLNPVSCGQSCTNAVCRPGTSCQVVKGFRVCVSDKCLNKENTTLVMNPGCDANYCTADTLPPATTTTPTATTTATPTTTATVTATATTTVTPTSSAVTVSRTSTTSKQDNDDLLMTFNVKVQNDVNRSRNLELTVTLSGELLSSYIQTGSISDSGNIINNNIVWGSLNIPANSSKTVTYRMLLPSNLSGRTFTDTINTEENNNLINSIQSSFLATSVPATALDADELQAIIAGIALVIAGFTFLKLQLHSEIGNFLWTNGLSQTLSKINLIGSSSARKTAQKERFEKELRGN